MKISDAIMAQFAATKLATDMDAKHGWGAEQMQAIREFAEDIGLAVQNDCRENGPRGRGVKQKLATALDADLGRVEREDAVVNRSGLGSVTLTQTAYRDAVRVAMILRSLHPEDLPDGLGPDPEPGTPDVTVEQVFGRLDGKPSETLRYLDGLES